MNPFELTNEQIKEFNLSVCDKLDLAGDFSSRPLYEYERLNLAGLLYWFISRNFFRLFSRFFILGLIIWVCFLGGMSKMLGFYLDRMKDIHKSNSPVSSEFANSEDIIADYSVSVSDLDSPEYNNFDAETELLEEISQKITDFDYLVFISPDFAVFCGGDYVRRGQRFVEDHYLGECYVTELNYQHGFVALSDGRIIRLRRSKK